MRNSVTLGLLVASALISPTSSAPLHSPLQAYDINIAEENRHYAKIPHAMLKIQDAAYIGEGQSATLVGKRGQPGSWHWARKSVVHGPLTISYSNGKLTTTLNGKLLSSAAIIKGVPIDEEIDLVGQTTQVGAGVNGWRVFVYNQKILWPRISPAYLTIPSMRRTGSKPASLRTLNCRPTCFVHLVAPESNFITQAMPVLLSRVFASPFPSMRKVTILDK